MRTSLRKIVLLVLAIAVSLTFAPPIRAAEGDVEINEAYFPDDAFREFVAQYDANGDGTLQVEELEAVTEIDLYGSNVVDLTGIKHFTNLANLDCGGCDELRSIDVSGCTSLVNLYYYGQELQSLNVTGCLNLKSLFCEDQGACSVSSLDLSSCTNLIDLRLYGLVSLQSLNITGCTNLEILFIAMGSSIKSLDLSDKTKLKKLGLSFIRFDSFDLSACKNLTQLGLFACGLKELDLSAQKDLQMLDCSDNRLTSLDVSGCADLWQFTAGEQWSEDVPAVLRGEYYEADLGVLYGVDIDNIKEVTLDDRAPLPDGFSYDPATGILKMDADPGYTAFKYVYDTNANLDKLDIPPAGYAEYDEEEEEDWRYRDSSPDLEVRFTINIVEESPVPPVVTQEAAEENDIEVDEETGVITYQQEQSKDIPLKIGGEDETVDDFQYVKFGNQQLSRKHYDVKSGSIIVTLKQSFLNSLTPGEYLIKLFTNKSVSSQTINVLGVQAPPADPDPDPEPETDPEPEPKPEPDPQPEVIDKKETEVEAKDKIPATGEHKPTHVWLYTILLLAVGSLLLLKTRSFRFDRKR